MDDRPADVVRHGYDAIAWRYREERLRTNHGPLARFLDDAVASVPAGAVALDLGCGAGEPVTAALAAHARVVVGVDLSARQHELAHGRLPEVALVHADMTQIAFREASFDAVLAFLSIIHAPRRLHGELLTRISAWLRPGGIFAGALGFGDNAEEREPDWLGAPMYWSHFDAATNLGLLKEAGLDVERSKAIRGTAGAEVFFGVIARKPALGGAPRPE
jgi:SAM-dependent methyltransferase